MERDIIIAPSVLSADFSDIRGALADIKASGTKWVHLDVMDGNFVPVITFGTKFIADIRPHSELFFDTHLMVNEPARYVEEFANAGSDSITVHVEACKDVKATLEQIKAQHVDCGISLKPSTPVSAIEPYLDMVDLVLVMSVEPGFGGQGLIPETLDKVRKLVELRGERKYRISIDGGVNRKTIKDVFASGVDVAVTGSAFFNDKDKKGFVQSMSKGSGV
jgi:ribulose-phosphate 3-epimerase